MRGRSVSPSRRGRLTAMVVAISSLATMPSVQADPIDDAQNLLLSISNFEATGIGPESILASWQRGSKLARAFRIEMATDEAGPYATVQTFGDSICDTQDRCVTEVKLGPPAHPLPRFLRVVPLLAIGLPEQNPNSMPVLLEGKPSEVDPALLGPRAPTNVQCNGGGALACVNVNSVTLTWTDNSDENKFWVMRARGNANPAYGTRPYAELPADTTSFSDVIDEYGVFYSYRIVAVRERAIPRLEPNRVDTELSFTNGSPRDIVVETAPVPPPSDPTGLTATWTPPKTVKLSWIDGAPTGFPYVEEDGWFIEQTEGGADFATLEASQHTKGPRAGQGTVTFTTTVPPDLLRCYRVRGYRATTTYTRPAYSGYTNTVCMGAPPSAPRNLIATALRSDTVKLTWVDTSNAETNFIVQRCNGECTQTSNGWATLTNAVPMNAQSYLDTTTVGETRYSYRVIAESPSGQSDPSNIDRVTTPEAPVPAPTGVLATALGSREIVVTWNDVTSAETGFRIEYKNSEGVFEHLNAVGANIERYTDEALRANERRCYRVRTIKGTKSSDPSSEACATTFPPAAPNGVPSGITATVASNTEIQISFTDNATNESRFEIEAVAWPHQGCPQNPTAMTFRKQLEAPRHSGTGVVSVRATGLIPHTAYIFRVRAVNPDGESGYSSNSPCRETFGPVLPVFVDPAQHADTNATRCDFTVKEPDTGADGAGGLKVHINAVVAGSLAHTDTLYVINSGGSVPGSTHDPDRAQFILTPGNGFTLNSTEDTWRINYRFRRGISYRIIVTAYGIASPYYASASNEVRDVTVLADCPTSGV
jgi:hypothetical protein